MLRACHALALSLCLGAQATAQERRLQLTARVLDALGEPIPAAAVWLEDRFGRLVARTNADATGRFMFSRPAPLAGLTLRARAAGKTQWRGTIDLEQLPLRDLALWDAATLRGRVRFPSGAPAVGAAISGSFGRSRVCMTSGAETTSDHDGRFVLRDVPLGMVDVRVIGAGLMFATRCVKVAGDDELELEVHPSELIGGARITGLEGLALADARIGVSTRGPLHPQFLAGEGRSMSLDPTGCCGAWLAGLPGNLQSTLWPVSATHGFLPPAARGGAGIIAAFAAYPRTRQRVRIVDQHGEGVAGEWVVCRSPGDAVDEAITDADGYATLLLPTPAGGTVTVSLLASRRVPIDEAGDLTSPVSRPIGADTLLRIVTQPGVTLHGRIQTAGAADVSRGVVRTWITSNRQSAPAGGTDIDSEGRFVIHGLPQLARLILQVESDAGFAVQRLTLSDELIQHADAILVAGAELRGLVKEADGTWVAGAQVKIGDQEALTDRHGRFRLHLAPMASALVEAVHDDRSAMPKNFPLPPGTVKELEFTIDRPRRR